MDEGKIQGNSDWLETYGLELEDRVPCDSTECPHAAEFYTEAKCCGAILLACAGCVEQARKIVVWMVHNKRMIVCDGCKAKNHPAQWLGEVKKLRLDFLN